jgi:hypothetical protein
MILRRYALCIFGVLLAMGGGAQAAPLGLMRGLPDIEAPHATVSYDAVTHVFSVVDGSQADFPVEMDGLPGADYYIANGQFTLTASVSSSGILSPGGTLSISGMDLYAADNSTLVSAGPQTLTGALTTLGFGQGNIFEFTFDVTGGTLANPNISFGPRGNVTVNAVASGFGGDFNTSFRSTGTADVSAVVPVPAAAWSSLALMGFLAVRRWHSRR